MSKKERKYFERLRGKLKVRERPIRKETKRERERESKKGRRIYIYRERRSEGGEWGRERYSENPKERKKERKNGKTLSSIERTKSERENTLGIWKEEKERKNKWKLKITKNTEREKEREREKEK